MRESDFAKLGACDLTVAGLRIWVHGRQFEDALGWDGDWLRVSVLCRYPGARVAVDGSILRLGEIVHFLTETEKAYEKLGGVATLDCLEPNLRVALAVNGNGHVSATIDVTPDHLKQTHRFLDELDQSHLPPIMASCKALLAKYPRRGGSE